MSACRWRWHSPRCGRSWGSTCARSAHRGSCAGQRYDAGGRGRGACGRPRISPSRPIPRELEGVRRVHRRGADADRPRQATGSDAVDSVPRETAGRALTGGRGRHLRVDRLSRLYGRRLRADPGARVGPRRSIGISSSATARSGSIPATSEHRLDDDHQGDQRLDAGSCRRRLTRSTRDIVTAGTHMAPSIEVAEAAKVIENTQRDLNIALMNELGDHLPQARHRHATRCWRRRRTKWNFLPVPAWTGRRPLHRGRSLLPDPPGAGDRLSSAR